MHHIPRLSETVYGGMCVEVGTPTEVRIRREVKDIEDTVWRSLRGFDIMTSGSHREGFRLQTSDVDVMLWFTDQKVICDLSHIGLYRIPQHTVILMECEDLPPGFTRLKMITPTGNQYVKLCCVMINGEHFVFGSLFRARFLQDMQNARHGTLKSFIQHGPCATFTFNEIEGDLAFCFRSHHWPNEALPWIQRCQLQNWPLESVLSSIIIDGCHVVPISSEPSNPEKDSEWRISFSRAEQKLVYSMNHCQFLCYGLLKFFLKEVINADANDPCLCSYFMKTVLFWVIQNDSFLDWVPCNLLICFWACFRLLISWVYKGECPNFFMPQNNMFRVKVVGQKQAALFEQLYGLYCKGIPCLLISPTIQKYLEMPILNRTLAFRTSEDSIISEVYLDLCLFSEIVNRDGGFSRDTSKVLFPKILNLLEQLQKTHLTSFQRVAVQHYLSFLFRYCSWILLNQNFEILSNKNNIHIYKRSLTMMKLAVKIGCVSEMLHLSMFYYKANQYERSLSCLQKAQDKMSKPYVLYYRYVNEEIYRRAMAGVSLGDRMRKCLIIDIILTFDIAYIDELILEQTTTTAEGSGNLVIPPFVMLHMLFVLNHQRLGNTVRSQQSIQDLHTLLLFDDWTRVPADCRDISWQILGICQQISGEYVEALNSFQCSLQQIPRHRIQEATMSRIRRMYE